jgi:hypothetical protein
MEGLQLLFIEGVLLTSKAAANKRKSFYLERKLLRFRS